MKVLTVNIGFIIFFDIKLLALAGEAKPGSAQLKARPCGVRPGNIEEFRIVDGTDAVPHSWPWMVSILHLEDGEYNHFCGGSLVARNKVLTAAHCFKYKEPKEQIKVRLGVHSRYEQAEGQIEMDVVRYDIHENYDNKTKASPNDIALITLKQPVNYTDNISPVCIGEKGQLNVNSTCIVTGWGDTQYAGSLSIYLQQLKMPIIDDGVCKNVTDKVNDTSQFCAGYLEGGKDSCQGDSGGPLVCKDTVGSPWRLHGIVSYGSICAKKGKAGVYTRVSFYRRWIADHINN